MSVKPTNQSAVLANVASSATSVTLFSASATGDRRYVFNDGTSILYVALTATAASTTNFSFKLATMTGQLIEDYSGPVTGIWDVANGSARTTEW